MAKELQRFDWRPEHVYLMGAIIGVAYVTIQEPFENLSGDSPGSINPHSFENLPTNLWKPGQFRFVLDDLIRAEYLTQTSGSAYDYNVTEEGLISFQKYVDNEWKQYDQEISKQRLTLEQLESQIRINNFTLEEWKLRKIIFIVIPIISFLALIIAILSMFIKQK